MLSLDTLTSAIPAPSFDEPLDMLYACHDKVRHFCEQLDTLPGYIASHGHSHAAQNTISGIVRYFEIAGPAHHQDEEQELFPLIVARQPDAAAKIEQLLAEHRFLQARWSVIHDQLQAFGRGELADLDATAIADFTRLYREHAQREEDWLFPVAGQLIGEDELRDAGKRMAARRTTPR